MIKMVSKMPTDGVTGSKIKDIIESAKAELEYICDDSANLGYLKDFTHVYNKYRDRLYKLSVFETKRNQALNELEQMIDKIILYKLSYSKNCAGILDHVDCMSEMKPLINNKYLRYRIYALSYQINGDYYFSKPDGRDRFIQFMKFIYLAIRGLLRNFPSTDTYKSTNNKLVDLIKASCK